MIIWNGTDIIVLIICGAVLLLAIGLIGIGILQKKIKQRKGKKENKG